MHRRNGVLSSYILQLPVCTLHAYLTQFIPMLYTIAAILLVLWLVGLVTSYTLGGFVHLLVVLAVIVVLVRLMQGKRPIA